MVKNIAAFSYLGAGDGHATSFLETADGMVNV
jgi:hypothetical protein